MMNGITTKMASETRMKKTMGISNSKNTIRRKVAMVSLQTGRKIQELKTLKKLGQSGSPPLVLGKAWSKLLKLMRSARQLPTDRDKKHKRLRNEIIILRTIS